MQFQGAMVTKEGHVFGIVVVKKSVIEDVAQAKKAMTIFQKFFGKTPILLMALDDDARALWYGKQELMRLVTNVSLEAIKWRHYDIPTASAAQR